MSLSNKVEQFGINADLHDQFVNGDANKVVQTAGGPVPSLAKFTKDNQAKIDAQTALRADLSATGGATRVGVAGGGSLQAKLDSIQQSIGDAGGANFVGGVGPDATGNVVIDTDDVPEGAAQYFTDTRVRGVLLTGLNLAISAAVTATDTVLAAIGKLQRQVSDLAASKVGTTAGKVNFTNVAGAITSFFTNANTAVRTYAFPDKSGTVAMLDDIGAGGLGRVLLASTTLTAAANPLTWLNLFSADYDTYEIELRNYSPTTNDILFVRLAIAGTVVVNNAYYIMNFAGASASTPATSGWTLQASYPHFAGIAAASMDITVNLPATGGSFNNVLMRANGHYRGSGSELVNIGSYGVMYPNSVPTGIQLLWGSGAQFSAGTVVRIYGRKK